MRPEPDGPGEMAQLPDRIGRLGELAQDLSRWTSETVFRYC